MVGRALAVQTRHGRPQQSCEGDEESRRTHCVSRKSSESSAGRSKAAHSTQQPRTRTGRSAKPSTFISSQLPGRSSPHARLAARKGLRSPADYPQVLCLGRRHHSIGSRRLLRSKKAATAPSRVLQSWTINMSPRHSCRSPPAQGLRYERPIDGKPTAPSFGGSCRFWCRSPQRVRAAAAVTASGRRKRPGMPRDVIRPSVAGLAMRGRRGGGSKRGLEKSSFGGVLGRARGPAAIAG